MNARHVAPLLAPLLALVLGTAAAAPDKCQIEMMTIPVRLVESRPVATVKLNGVPVPLLVDSGAFYSFLSEASARQLNLRLKPAPDGLRVYGITGAVQALKITTVQSVVLEQAELKGVEFLVGGNEINAGIMGVLGRNFLSVADTEYDLAHGVVRLVFPKGDCEKTSLAYWAGDAPVIEAPLISYARNDRAVRVPVLINGEKVRALMDTGAPSTALMIGAARKAGIAEADLKPAGRSGGAGAEFAREWTARVDRFELGGEKVSNNQMRVTDASDNEYGMLLGLDYFLSHRVYVSRLQGKVYATWNGGPVFAKDAAKTGDYDQRYAAKAEAIAADDADGFARRGNAALVAGDPARALEDLDRAIAGRADLALAALRATAPELSVEPFLSDVFFLVCRRDHPLARRRRPSLAELNGQPLIGLARHSSVRQALDAALPPGANLRAAMAQMHARRDEAPQALKQFDLWIRTHPRDLQLASMHGERCWMRTRMNLEIEQAVDDCKEAVDLDDQEATYHSFLGWARLRQGEAAAARKAFDRAIALKPLAWAHYGRGVALTRLNEPDKARQDFEAARRIAPAIDERVRRAGFEALAVALKRPE
ncbi:tetratricopeptide repeat protein [Mitsuaria sp. TWR114]|uniref:retroviral-like aspartic protease family protein n=1 Tax=Mitsuaria sp. TWR114 TaxID=2601731 RepID=UPI0011BF4E1F|nr:aspartyl protease family protein [Mitsuaria sp. TWR114]TXD93322.1 tetratricopeptide repeat protein [Mitsuaria sp. TWR114]